MPYIQVWVDDADCDGDCEAGKQVIGLQAQIDEAIGLLSLGCADAALSVLHGEAVTNLKSPREIERAYKQWRECALPGFTNYKKHEERLNG